MTKKSESLGDDGMYGVAGVARLTGVSCTTVIRWCDSQLIRFVRLPTRAQAPRRFRPQDIYQFMLRHKQTVSSELLEHSAFAREVEEHRRIATDAHRQAQTLRMRHAKLYPKNRGDVATTIASFDIAEHRRELEEAYRLDNLVRAIELKYDIRITDD